MSKRRASNRPSVTPQIRVKTLTEATASWGPAIVLAVLTLGAYLPALSAGFIWDDDSYLTNNSTLVTSGGLWRIWFELGATVQYYPLVFTSFWIEHRLWGFSPSGYHLVNVLLHAGAAVLFWRILHRLNVPGAWWAAAIFALHPVHAESVTWVTERKNVLSMVFYLLAARAYLRFLEMDTMRDASHRVESGRPYAATLAWFVCALLSKTTTVALPIALLLVTWWKTGRLTLRDGFRLAPLLAAAVAAGLVTSRVESHHVGAGELDWSLSWPQRFMLAGRSLVFYLFKLLWPTNLSFIYDRWTIGAARLADYGYLITVVMIGAGLWLLRERLGRGPLAAYVYFVVGLLPALGFVQFWFMNYSFVADHFQYLASLGPIALAGAGLSRLDVSLRRIASSISFTAGQALGTVLIAALAILTWQRAGDFHDLETLWFDVLNKSETARPMAHKNLAVHYASVGRWEDSVKHYEAALSLSPDEPEVRGNLAVSLYQLGRREEARMHWQEAVRIRPNNPQAWNNLGLLAADRGDWQEAVRCYREALRHAPHYADGYFNLGKASLRLGRREEAVQAFREVLRINPADGDAARELSALGAVGQGP